MNSKPPPKPSPSYDGPMYLGKLPMVKRTDAPETDGVPESPSGLHRAFNVVKEDVAKSRRLRIKVYSIGGIVLSGLLAGGGKFALAKGDTIETKTARIEEKQKNDEKVLDVLTARVDAGEKAQQHTALKVERVEALLELELDMHGIPKSKRPPKVDDQ